MTLLVTNAFLLCQLVLSVSAQDHVVLKGRLLATRYAGSSEEVAMTAVYCFASLTGSDTQAIGVMEAAKEAGLRIPEEFSVIGFDDIEIAAYLGLTTVRHPLYESGLIAAELVIRHIKDPDCTPQMVEQDLEVIVRSTTGPPPER